jgi:hypothetical protein
MDSWRYQAQLMVSILRIRHLRAFLVWTYILMV